MSANVQDCHSGLKKPVDKVCFRILKLSLSKRAIERAVFRKPCRTERQQYRDGLMRKKLPGAERHALEFPTKRLLQKRFYTASDSLRLYWNCPRIRRLNRF